MTAPRRRWTFGLRTLFVVLTVVCCWLGWEVNVVRKRAFAAAWIKKHEDACFWQLKADDPYFVVRMSWIRRMLGDHYVAEIGFPSKIVTLDEIHWIEKVFPEATVYVPSSAAPQLITSMRPDGVLRYPPTMPVVPPAAQTDRP